MSWNGPESLTGLTKKLADSRPFRDLVLFVPLVAVFFVAGELGFKLAFFHPGVAAVWIPSGIALAAFIVLGYRVWPAILLGCFLLILTRSGPLMTSVVIAAGGTLEGLAGAYLVNKFARSTKAFNTAEDVFRFTFFACVLSTSVSATIGVGTLCLSGLANRADCPYLWLTWWLADAVGVLLVAPFLILVFSRSDHRLDRRELLELTVLVFGLIFVCLLVFSPLSPSLNKSHFVQVWMCIPFLIWAAFRFCQIEAAGTTLILFGSAVWGTLRGYGPFVTRDLNISLLTLDAFIGVIGTMTLAVAAMVAERRQIEERLLGLQTILQAAVEGKARDLTATVDALHVEVVEHFESQRALRESHERFRQLVDSIPDVFWLLDTITERILYVSPGYESIWGRSCESLYADAHSWLDAVHPEDHERALAFFDRESQEDRFEVEYRILRPDGSERWIYDRGFVVRDESGRICRLAGLASDITEKKQLEGSLRTSWIQKPETDRRTTHGINRGAQK